MLKIRSDAIKTLAKTVARTKEKAPKDFLAETESPEIIYFNRKLREAFGLFVAPQNMPLPTSQSAPTKTESDIRKPPEIVVPMPVAEEIAKKEPQREKGIKEKTEEELARRREEAAKKAAEERLRQEQEKKEAEEKKRQEEEAARKAEEEKARQLAALEAERAKKAEEELARRREEAAKKAAERRRQEEENKKREEERAANSLPITLKKLVAKLEEKKAAEGKKAAEIPAQKIPLEQKRRILESKIAMIRKSELAIVEEKEREIEARAATKRNELEKNPDRAKEKTLKQGLWQIEDSRKEIEKQRWAVEDKINKIKIDAESVDRQIAEKTRQLEASEEEISRISGQVALVRFAAEKIRAEEEILKIIGEKESLAPELAVAENKKNDIEKKLADLAEKESLVSQRLNDIETEEARAKDLVQKREIEKSRWQANNDLKSIVEEKWSSEEKLNSAATGLKLVQGKTDSLDAKIESIQNKITAAEIELEEKELPVHALRDAIRRLLEENLVNFNPKIISRIVQIGKSGGKPNGENKAAAEKTPLEKTDEGKKPATEPARPQADNPAQNGGTAKKEDGKPMEKIPATNAVLRAEKVLPKENTAQADNPAQNGGTAKKEGKQTTAVAGTGGKPNGESKAAAEKTPLEKTDEGKKPATEPARPQADNPAQNGGTAKKEDGKPMEKIPATNAVLRAEKVLPKENTAQAAKSDFPKNKAEDFPKKEPPNAAKTDLSKPPAAPATAAAAEDAAGEKPFYGIKTPTSEEIAKMAEHNGSVYRERVEATPARNIRTFDQQNPAKVAAGTTETKKNVPPAEETTIAGIKPVKTTETEPEISEDGFAANPENRWQQIKKTTLPATAIPPKISLEDDSAPIMPEEAAESKKSNLLARILIIFAVIAVLGIVLAVILIKNGGEPVVVKDDPKPAGGATSNPPEEKPAAPAIVTTISTVTIYVDNIANIPSSISPYMRKKFDANGYHALSIIDKSTGKKIGLKQFFNAYKVSAPSVLYNSVKDDCEFFIYANNGKNRIGFAAGITNTAMIEPAMAGWEGSIVKDTENLFRLLGRKALDESGSFSFADGGTASATYKIMNFAPPEDEFAIAWTNYRQTYFIFSTSNNSMIKIFNQLPK